MQPSSEAYEIENSLLSCQKIVLPHPAAANLAGVAQFCPNKSSAGVICNKPLDPKQHHCCGCRYGGGVDRGHAALARCLAKIIQSHSGVKVFIEQKVPALTRVCMSPSLLLSLAIRPWCLLPTQSQDLWPRERRRPNSTGTHTSIWSRSFLRQQADLVHMPGNSLTTCCEMLTTHQLRSETLGPPSKVSSTVPSPNNNLRDSWGPLSHSVCSVCTVLMGASTVQTAFFSVSSLLQLCHVALL